MPDSLVTLDKLQKLDLKANDLEKLPAGFERLSALKHLDLSFNEPLNMVTASGQLQHMKQLEVLDISFNKLNPQIYYELKRALPHTMIVAKGFNNLVPIER